MVLNSLPPEIILQIGKHILQKQDLNAVIRSSRRLATCLTPELYNKAFNPRNTATDMADFSADMINGIIDPSSSKKISTVSGGRLWEPAKCWASDIVVNYFENMPLEWLGRVRFIGMIKNLVGGMNEAALRLDKGFLELIILAGNKLLIKVFLDRGVDVELRGGHDMTPLNTAAKAGHIEIVQLLLASGADVLARDRYQRNSLSLAIEAGNFDVALLLIEADRDGLSIGNISANNSTPLHQAASSRGSLVVAKRLLARGANVFILSGIFTALDFAISHKNEALALMIIEKMLAVPEELAKLGPSWGASKPLLEAIRFCLWSVVRRLVKEGVDLEGSMNPAIEYGAQPIFGLFLEAGPETWPPTTFTSTIVKVAKNRVLAGLQMIVSLHEKGKLQIDVPMMHRESILNYVVGSPKTPPEVPEMIKLLLGIGVSTEARSPEGWNETPLQICLRHFRGESEGPLFETIRILIDASTDFSMTDSLGNNYLLQLAFQNFWEKSVNVDGEIAVVQKLLSKGMDINARGHKRNTALHFVSARKHPVGSSDFEIQNHHDSMAKLIQFLLSKGANPNLRNAQKRTPLRMLSGNSKDLQSVVHLVNFGADLSAANRRQEPPIHRPAAKGLDDVVTLLVKSGGEKHIGCKICTAKIAQLAEDGRIQSK